MTFCALHFVCAQLATSNRQWQQSTVNRQKLSKGQAQSIWWQTEHSAREHRRKAEGRRREKRWGEIAHFDLKKLIQIKYICIWICICQLQIVALKWVVQFVERKLCMQKGKGDGVVCVMFILSIRMTKSFFNLLIVRWPFFCFCSAPQLI